MLEARWPVSCLSPSPARPTGYLLSARLPLAPFLHSYAVMTTELRPGAPPRIIASGLPLDVADRLDEALGAIGLLSTVDPDEAMQEIARGDYSLLIINHTLTGPPAMDVLSRVRANPNLVNLPVLYLLDRNLDSELGRKLLEQLGVRQ